MVWSERMSPMSSICLYFVIVFSLFNHTCYTYRILSCICRRISAFLLFTSINHSWSSFSSLALLLPTERVEHIRTTAWALNSSKTYITLNSYILVNVYPIHCTDYISAFFLGFLVCICTIHFHVRCFLTYMFHWKHHLSKQCSTWEIMPNYCSTSLYKRTGTKGLEPIKVETSQ